VDGKRNENHHPCQYIIGDEIFENLIKSVKELQNKLFPKNDELKKEHWYCTTCKERKEPISASATYGETCEDCGTALIYVYNWMKLSYT